MPKLDRKSLKKELEELEDDDREVFIEVVTEWLPKDGSLTGAIKKMQETIKEIQDKVKELGELGGKKGEKKPFFKW